MSEKSLEHFQKKVDEIKVALDEIKKTTDSDIEKKKQDLDKKIYAATSAIDDELEELKKDSDKNKDRISKLEELKTTLDTFTPELASLKKEVIESNSIDSKEDAKPSLFATIFYGGILGKVAGNIPLVGDVIKDWADNKLKESAKENTKEKENDKDTKSGFWSKAWKWLGGAALVGGAIALGNKASSAEGGFLNTIKGRFSNDKKEETPAVSSSVSPENTATVVDPIVESTPTVTSESPAVSPESSSPESSESNTQEELPLKEIQTMRSQGMSELYILMRMFELGYVPKIPYPKNGNIFTKGVWVVDGGPLHSLGTMKSWLIASLKFSKNEIIQQKLANITKNPSLLKYFDKQMSDLIEMEKFLSTSNPDGKAFQKRFLAPDVKARLQYTGKDPVKIKQSIESQKTKLGNIESHIKTLDKEIAEIQKNAQNKLAEYDKLAKAHAKDPKKLAQIRKESQAYIKEYNTKITHAQTLLLEDMTKVPNKSELLRMSSDNISFSTLIKTNGGVDGFLTKITSSKTAKAAGKVGLAIAVMKIVGGGFGEFQKQGFLSKETGLDAADLGLGLVPLVGGLYDIGMAIRGKDLNGRDMAGWERWVRGGIGAASSVVDVFTFGVGGTAIRGLSKIGVKTAVKAAQKTGVEVAVKTGVRIAEKTLIKTTIKGLEVGMQLASYSFLGYAVYQEAAPATIRIGEQIDHKTESNVDLHI